MAEYVTFTLELESGNAAMVDDPRYAVARLLRQTADRLEEFEESGVLLDENGNRVGEWGLDVEEDDNDE